MHVILGDGEMTRRELTQTLNDLMKADEEADQPFWFLLQGKSDPTDTDKAIVTWLEKNQLYYEIVTDDPESVDEIYSQPQEVHTAKRLAQKVVALLNSKPEEGESAEILALFYDVNDATAAEDKWLNGVIQSAFDAGFPTRALNDGLVEVDLSIEAAEAEAEPEPAKPVKKSVAKRAARTPVTEADSDVTDEDATSSSPTATELPTREELEDMEPTQVKEIAASMGIVLPPRTRSTTYIDHILGEAKGSAPVAEVTEADLPSVNGDMAIDELADLLADRLIEKLAKLLTA